MPRQPVHKEGASRLPTGRQAIWARLREHREVTLGLIGGYVRMDKSSIRTYLRALAKAGYVEIAPPVGPGKPATYKLVKDAGAQAPRVRDDGRAVTQGSGVAKMWRTMRVMKTFSWHEIAAIASVGEETVAESTARAYCGWLEKAGYLRVREPGGPNRAAVYQLARDTGPKAPQIQRIDQVYDPNTKEVVYARKRGESS